MVHRDGAVVICKYEANYHDLEKGEEKRMKELFVCICADLVRVYLHVGGLLSYP